MPVEVRRDLANGQIRFESNHSLQDVIRIATEWKDGEHGAGLEYIAVRQCGTDRFGIAFAYKTDGSKEANDKLMYKLTDQLKRRFGNDVTWDITSSLWVIK